MKRTILSLLFVMTVVSMFASPVDLQRAKQVAQQFVPQVSSVSKAPVRSSSEEQVTIVYTHMMPNSDRAAFYIINVGSSSFVLVSADDVAHPILGYSQTDKWPVSSDGSVELPAHIKSFFDDLAAQIETVIDSQPNHAPDPEWTTQKSSMRSSLRSSSNLPDSVGPLLTTTWDQGQFYNSLCPEDENGPGGHTYAGCVATAMAQIIKYWGYPMHGRGMHSYDTEYYGGQYGVLSVDYDKETFLYEKMTNSLTAASSEEQINAISRLIYDCGVAVNTFYKSNESSAITADVRGGLINYFMFSPDLSYAQKYYYTENEWDSLFHENLALGYPIFINNSNHSFVCDGYNSSNYYHFNFGWGGLSDGWYLMSAVNDDGGIIYSSSFGAILGIRPDNNCNVILGQSLGNSNFIFDEPMEFYSSMGHNKYFSTDYSNGCYNNVIFSCKDSAKKIVIDVMKYEGQTVDVNSSSFIGPTDRTADSFYANCNSVELYYSGYQNSNGFALYIRTEEDCEIPTILIERDTSSIRIEKINKMVSAALQIEYGLRGFEQGKGVILNAESSVVNIDNLKRFASYDIYVRSVFEGNRYSPWVKHTVVLDPYWTDIVKEQPEGYFEDEDGNVEISSAQGMAWLSVLVNGLNGHQPNSFEGKIVTLISDINLDGYRWYPMGRYINWEWTKFSGTFDGQDHSISNIYVRDAGSNLGLFGRVEKGKIRNVKMVGGSVSSTLEITGDDPQYWLPSSTIGGLIGEARECFEITNCHSSVNVSGNGGTGSLCGMIWTYETQNIKTIISNCSANGTVSGREACGGLIGGIYGKIILQNCYATGDVLIIPCFFNAWEMGRGGLIGSFRVDANVFNCFSTGHVYSDSEYNRPTIGNIVGYVDQRAHVQFLYGRDDINQNLILVGNCTGGSNDSKIVDTICFSHNGNMNTLLMPISINGTTRTDLLDALNAWVKMENDEKLKTWLLDSITGYPTFGSLYEPTCYNPSNLIASNATVVGDTIIRTQLSWTQIGKPDHWEVLIVPAQHELSEGSIISVDSNPCLLTNITVGCPLDFYVRAIGGDKDVTNWSDPITYIPDKLRWTEVVTSQPEGYFEDTNGNVIISTAEGLAWLSSVSNSLNGLSHQNFWGRSITIVNDIDISLYRWTPIGASWSDDFGGCDIIGNNHIISGLYCNELDDYIGLFGYMGNSSIQNLILKRCDVKGGNETGTLVGRALSLQIRNCAVEGNVLGIESPGGIVGRSEGCKIINSCFIGNVLSRTDITKVSSNSKFNGGICGVPAESSIINCYVVCEISDVFDFSGIITSTANIPENVSNCYYKYYETNLEVTHTRCKTTDNSSFTGGGNIWTLNTPPFVNGEFRTDLVDALNAWVDANDTDGIYRHWVPDTSNVNGGFPIFAPLPKFVITFQNDDKTVLQVDTLFQGAQLKYEGVIPRKERTAQYTYVFAGWSPELSVVTGDATYTAVYDSIVNTYVLVYKLDDEIYKVDSLAYNAEIIELSVPVKDGYTFSGWSEIPTSMPANDVEIKGTFIVNKYLLKVLVGEKVVFSDSIAFGTPLANYIELITQDGIDISAWEWYDDMEKTTMPAHDVVIEGIMDAVTPISLELKSNSIYDLKGKRIDVDNMFILPPGFYIYNGKIIQIAR